MLDITPAPPAGTGASAPVFAPDAPAPRAPVPIATDPAAQVADAIRLRTNERSVTVRLDPPELGTVRMEFGFERGVVTALVSADQPATADLLRRHADWLHQSLADAGLEGAEIGWAEGGERPSETAWRALATGEADETYAADTSARAAPLRVLPDGAIDIRL